jgi:hypothetical protein
MKSNDPSALSPERQQALSRLLKRNDDRRREILQGIPESMWQIELRMRRQMAESVQLRRLGAAMR